MLFKIKNVRTKIRPSFKLGVKILEDNNEIDSNLINKAAEVIKNGGLVVFPTETVYGIGANALDEDAIKKLYIAKGRSFNKKTSILVGSIDMLNKVTQDVSPVEKRLIEKFFPGPLTIILHKQSIIPGILTNNESIVGFRMPDNQIALDLINKVGSPIATSSANKSGELSGVNIEDIKDIFKEEVDFYIDGGKSKLGIASTIVQVIDGIPCIIREGTITKEDLEKAVNE